MGFGLLLCAYFLFTFMSVGIGDFCFVTYLVGALVALRAVRGLKDYNPRFAYLYPAVAIYALLAVYFALIFVEDIFMLGLPIHAEVLTTVVNVLRFVAELAFSAVALWSSAELAATVGLKKHQARGMRNLLFVGIWALGQLLLLILSIFGSNHEMLATEVIPMLTVLLLFYQLVVYFLNSLLLYSCFSAICPKGEEFGKPSKPSRFRFINDINAKLDAKNEQARREYEARMNQSTTKYSAKNHNRHHKKKK